MRTHWSCGMHARTCRYKTQFRTRAGHGSDENQCAEFCVTSHCFRVNGVEHWVNFTQAGTPWGCTKTVLPS